MNDFNETKIESAVTEIAELAERGMKPQLVHQDHRQSVYYVNKEIYLVDSVPGPRRHKVHSVDGIVLMASTESLVWHHGNQVCVVMDNGDESLRRDRAEWSLTPTDAWKAMYGVYEKITQEKLLNLLTDDLRTVIREQAPEVLASLRTVKFTTNDQQEGDLQRNMKSVGRSVQNAVTGLDTVPDQVKLKTKRWAELEHEIELEMQIIPDPDTRTFTFRASRDEVAAAELIAQDWLGEYLRRHLEGTECHVIAGTCD